MCKKGFSYKLAPYVLILLTFSNFSLANKIIYVDDDANVVNNGTSWQNAYKYLQDALTDANSSEKPLEIRVAQGTYKPDQGAGQTAGDRESSFILTGGVILSGGYAGIFEIDPNERNYQKYETILTGDLSGNDIAVNDPNDLADEPTRGENSYSVITAFQADSLSVLDGFEITGGTLYWGRGFSYGGGIRMGYGKLQICNCSFISNFGGYGAGVLVGSGQVILVNCIFKSNAASEGGAIYVKNNGVLKLVRCIFENNFAESKGGAIYNEDSKIIIENSSFKNNIAFNGGAVYLHNSLQYSSLKSSLFVDNSAANNGGALYMESSSISMEIANFTFAQNSALHGKAIFTSSGLKIRNSILYNGGQDEVWNNNA
jgi:predicted outer membrane repeat protein